MDKTVTLDELVALCEQAATVTKTKVSVSRQFDGTWCVWTATPAGKWDLKNRSVNECADHIKAMIEHHKPTETPQQLAEKINTQLQLLKGDAARLAQLISTLLTLKPTDDKSEHVDSSLDDCIVDVNGLFLALEPLRTVKTPNERVLAGYKQHADFAQLAAAADRIGEAAAIAKGVQKALDILKEVATSGGDLDKTLYIVTLGRLNQELHKLAKETTEQTVANNPLDGQPKRLLAAAHTEKISEFQVGVKRGLELAVDLIETEVKSYNINSPSKAAAGTCLQLLQRELANFGRSALKKQPQDMRDDLIDDDKETADQIEQEPEPVKAETTSALQFAVIVDAVRDAKRQSLQIVSDAMKLWKPRTTPFDPLKQCYNKLLKDLEQYNAEVAKQMSQPTPLSDAAALATIVAFCRSVDAEKKKGTM